MKKDIDISFCGRLGNMMFQYAVARAYAECHGAVLHAPSWIGQQIFELPNHPGPAQLPGIGFDAFPDGRVNISLAGYFQYQEAVDILSRTKLQEWFKIQPRWHNLIKRVGIAAHVRRGDYLGIQHIFCIVTEQSYINACREIGKNPSDIFWVREEAPRKEHTPPGLEFLPDFLTLIYAEILLRANSTFSWWASVLSDGETYSPLVEAKKGHQDVKFVKGNWPRLIDTSNSNTRTGDLYVPP